MMQGGGDMSGSSFPQYILQTLQDKKNKDSKLMAATTVDDVRKENQCSPDDGNRQV